MPPIPSSFSGEILEIPEIWVDNFENIYKKAYFLSHYHADHVVGLEKRSFFDAIKQTGANIYMSESTSKIFEERVQYPDAYEYVVPLKLGTTTVAIDTDLFIEVTLIPAGHCIGSVMFLFRTINKTILYTGDFRISPNDISKYAQFHKNGEPINIDVMYVDTTFIKDQHPIFPKRSDTVDEMVHRIDSWLKEAPNNRIAIHTSGSYTSEFSFREIHRRLGKKVCVKKELWMFYSRFPEIAPAVTCDESDPEIHLCYYISSKNRCHYKQYLGNNYLSLHLSARKWTAYESDHNMLKDSFSNDTIDVCFATHCSRSEVLSFVNYFNPTKVVGFPNPYDQNSPQKVEVHDFVKSPKKRKLNLLDTLGK